MKIFIRTGAALLLASSLVTTGCAREATGEHAPRTIEVSIRENGTEMYFEPARIEARRGDIVRFTQHGVVPHNVQFVRNDAPDGVDIGEYWSGPFLNQKGESYEVVVDERFADGAYEFNCLPHIALGMAGTLVVDGGRPAAAPGANVAADLPEIRGERGLQELAYEMDGAVKVFRLTAEKIRWETREGKLVDAMAYNRMIPGPVIRVGENERVRIVVTNKMDEPHTTHWHGLFVPNSEDGVPGISQDPIMPGESFTYEFNANPAGTRLYHSHFNAMSQECAGLYGMFVIEERNTPPSHRADREELMLLGDGPLGFVVNGKEFPMTEPIQMKKGERLRIRMANLGAMYHPMHLHGGYFTVIAKDGFPLPAPQDMNTLSIGPGETFDVILHPQFGGTWIWHCHVLSHATGPRDEDGNETATGMIGVVVVDDGSTQLADLSNHRNH
jgi:manganese oxidase